MRRSLLFTALLFGSAFPGCNEHDVAFPELVGCSVEDNGTLELSTTPDAFEGVEDGAGVRIAAGFQGGYHVFATLRSQMRLDNPVLVSMNICQGDAVVARNRVESDFNEVSNRFQSDNHLIYVLHDYRPEQLDGQPSLVAVRLSDASGRRAEALFNVVTECCDELQ